MIYGTSCLFSDTMLKVEQGDLKTNCNIPEDGSVFGCHCENSFPDTYNNIQCYRNSTNIT